jgi:hypothetical protein
MKEEMSLFVGAESLAQRLSLGIDTFAGTQMNSLLAYPKKVKVVGATISVWLGN